MIVFGFLKKEIESDFKEVDLDWKAGLFTDTVRNMLERSSLSKTEKKEIEKHLARYEKVCDKDFNLRFPRLFNKMDSYAEKKGKNWFHDFSDNKELLGRMDSYAIQYNYGSKALEIYLHLDENKKMDFIKSLNGISSANLSLKEIDRRKSKYIDSYFNNLFRKSKAKSKTR